MQHDPIHARIIGALIVTNNISMPFTIERFFFLVTPKTPNAFVKNNVQVNIKREGV